MSYDDFNRGRLGFSGGGEDNQRGRQEQQRRQDDARRQNEERQREEQRRVDSRASVLPVSSSSDSPRTTGDAQSPLSLASSARGGASAAAALFLFWALSRDAWTWPSIIGGTCMAAGAGLCAGALLYIAVQVIKTLLRIGAVMMVVGVALQLFAGVDFIGFLQRATHALWR